MTCWETIAEMANVLPNQKGISMLVTLNLTAKEESRMTFIYDEAKSSAVDSDKGITVTMSQTFTDSYPVMLYEYVEHGRKFEFSLITKSEYRHCIFRGRDVNMRLPLSITIGERSLSRAVHGFLQENLRTVEEYSKIKENIRDAMMCIATFGGEIEKLTPDLVISFGEISSN
jgi:hypothetical protein